MVQSFKILLFALGVVCLVGLVGVPRLEAGSELKSAGSQTSETAAAKVETAETEGTRLDAQRSISEARPAKKASYKQWKRRLPFWPRKSIILLELVLYISMGVFFAQILEVSGLIKYLAVLAWPVTKLGGLGRASGPAFIAAFQSGAVANSMLAASTDRGTLNKRQLYSSVLIVSCLSLFAHLPTYVIPIGSVLGLEATAMLFGVRFAAIFFEIIAILIVSNFLIRPWTDTTASAVSTAAPREVRSVQERTKGFWTTVWLRSRRTLKRLIIFLLPTYVLMALAEHLGFFNWLSDALPSLFTLSFLPSQATVIIPAQAMSLYNGAIVAASFLDSGALTAKQAVFIILVGSLITAPVRTFKHALPTYVAVLGPKTGFVMAISAQVLRSIFLIVCIVAMWLIWN